MVTIVLVSAAVGAALGLGVGWKLGRGFERVRPAKNDQPKPRARRRDR